MCNSARHPKVTPDSDTITYAFVSDPHPGCTYYCVVDKKTNQILDTRFEGTKEACSLTLN